ncbi:MAG: magnesium transporter, partial [Oscillospiraceae bacterium]|nr:magnesium transporter [Oscillospiraceae bacterium]
HDFGLAIVVSITLFMVVIAAELVGCSLPLIATKLNLDPALMASPLITTIVDALSMLVFFNVAMQILPGM